MNDDLNTALHRAVDAVLDEAVTPDAMRRNVAERIRAKHRRRPALVIGATLGSLALVGGTAFAAVQLTDGDGRPRVPDVIGSPRPEHPGTPAPSPTTPDPSPTEEPTEEPAPAPDPVAMLPVAAPGAVAPQCGATIDQGGSVPEDAARMLNLTTSTEGEDLVAPGPATFAITLANMEPTAITGMTESALTLVLVKDGIVVGRAPDTAPAMEPFELQGSGQRQLQGTLWIEACSPDGPAVGRLPEGRYSVWAMQQYTVSARTYLQDDYSQSGLVPVDESHDFRFRLTDLWIDATGQPTQRPYRAAGMPDAVPVMTAMAGVVNPSVVWLALPSDAEASIDAASAAVDELGYGDALWPLMCQGAAQDAFGPDDSGRSGVALVFATRTEADRFTELYPGDVVGTVDGDVFCHFT